MKRGAWSLLPVLAAGPAVAHTLPQTFGAGIGALNGPFLLPLLSIGLMIAVAGRPRRLGAAAVGVPLGFAVAPLIGINADVFALGAGLACAILAASGLPLAGVAHGVLAVATAVLTGAGMTLGAGWRAMEPPALLALALGAAVAMALPLGLRHLLGRWPGPGRIGLRIAGSWLAAIGALALALTFAGAVP